MERLPSLVLMLGNSFMKRLAQQQATWTKGPSLPSHIPDATARHYVSQYVECLSLSIAHATYQPE